MAVVLRKLSLIEGGASGAPRGTSTSSRPRLRIAIASRDGTRLDAHFGYAPRLMVYDVTPDSHRLVQAIACSPEDSEHEGGREEEDRIGLKLKALAGCDLLFVLAIGPPAAARAIKADIYPVKLDAPASIDSVIAHAQQMMNEDASLWLRKVLGENRLAARIAKKALRRD